jgi:hypothetical protein
MRGRWKNKWMCRVGAVVLVGGLVLGTSSVVTQAGERDDDRHRGNPFDRILHKLDKILDAIKDGGGQDGHHTLRWDQNLPAAQRFVTLAAFNNQAVLDKNTGLVWEQAPDATFLDNWTDARQHCLNRRVGGALGWRLPSVVELKSVQDPSLPAPYVPTMVFSGVKTDHEDGLYWSASASLSPEGPWIVSFSVNSGQAPGNPDRLRSAWCVRGPMQEHMY